MIDSSLSGLEEVGYAFEAETLQQGIAVDLPNSIGLETRYGTVLLGIDLTKIETKRIRRDSK